MEKEISESKSSIDPSGADSNDQTESDENFVKKLNDPQIKIIGGIFIILDLLIIFTIVLSFLYIIPYIATHVSNAIHHGGFEYFNLQNFALIITPIIEFILFISLLTIIHIGIFVAIIKEIFIEGNVSLSKLTTDIIRYLGLPFLTVIGSLLAVSMLNIIMNIFLTISKRGYIGLNSEEFLSNFGLIVAIVIAILGIALLIKIEHSILGDKK